VKPTDLRPLRPSRRLFARTTPGLLANTSKLSGLVAVIGTLGLLASTIWR
jgi:hypothetical protein